MPSDVGSVVQTEISTSQLQNTATRNEQLIQEQLQTQLEIPILQSDTTITPFEKSLLELVTIPCGYDEHGELLRDVSKDAVILNCGCVISQKLVDVLTNNYESIGKFKCPLCYSTSKLLTVNKELRGLYSVLKDRGLIADETKKQGFGMQRNKKESLLSLFYNVAKAISEEGDKEESPDSKYPNDSHDGISETSSNISNLSNPISLSLSKHLDTTQKQDIKSSASSINSNKVLIKDTYTTGSISNLSSQSSLPKPLSLLSKFPSNGLSGTSKRRISGHKQETPNADPEHKEYLFVKCFPVYRAHYHHQTHSKLLKTKSKIFSNVSISPNCKFFVLLSSTKWEVYKIPSTNFKNPPALYCCGTSRGDYGTNVDKTGSGDKYRNVPDEIKGGGFSPTNDPEGFEFKRRITSWEHLYCSLSDSLLVISGTNGVLRVFDLNQYGKPIYSYCSNFPIRCISISSNSKLIAYGITGKDRISGGEQALIVMHSLHFSSSINDGKTSDKNYNFLDNPNKGDNGSDDTEFNLLGKLKKVDPITITFPYHDPINHVSFSNDSNYLSCSTALESRFLTVSVKDSAKPRLVMKAIRTLDTSLESEGITSFKMFPNNKYMVVSSVAFNAPPIIVDNNIRTTNTGSSISSIPQSSASLPSGTSTTGVSSSNITEDSTSELLTTSKYTSGVQKQSIYSQMSQRVAQPKLLQKLDEVGNNIHKVAISPRNDSIALLDKNGTVYLMFATNMDDSSSKRIVIVDQVSNSFRVRESASLCFSKDGHQLFIVDRKGVLYINDFSAGLPSSPEITRCKQLSTQ